MLAFRSKTSTVVGMQTGHTLELEIQGTDMAIDVEVDWEWDDGGWGASSVGWHKAGLSKETIDFIEKMIDESLSRWSREIKREPREPDVWDSGSY